MRWPGIPDRLPAAHNRAHAHAPTGKLRPCRARNAGCRACCEFSSTARRAAGARQPAVHDRALASPAPPRPLRDSPPPFPARLGIAGRRRRRTAALDRKRQSTLACGPSGAAHALAARRVHWRQARRRQARRPARSVPGPHRSGAAWLPPARLRSTPAPPVHPALDPSASRATPAPGFRTTAPPCCAARACGC